MEPARLVDHETAVVVVRADLLREPFARHRPAAHPEGRDLGQLGLVPGGVGGRPGEREMARAHVIAIDRLVAHERLDQIEGVDRRAVEPIAQLGAVAGAQRARAPLEPGVDHPAVARRGAPAERLGLQDGDARPAARDVERGGDAGIAAAHDGDVDARGKRGPGVRGEGGRGSVPVGPLFVAGATGPAHAANRSGRRAARPVLRPTT